MAQGMKRLWTPVAACAALALMGKIAPEIRLPMVALEGAALEKLKQVLIAHGLMR